MNCKNDYRFKEELWKDWPLLVVLLGLMVTAFIVYPQLPERVPMHWNMAGEVDNYGSRFTGAFAIPLLTVAIYIGMVFMPLIDPKKANYAVFLKAYRAIRTGLVLFFVLLYILTIAFALGYEVDIARLVPLFLGILFIIIGNFLSQVRHNYFVGIKTPWTLASEKVWRRTHRLGGFVFVAAGVISIAAVFFPPPFNFWAVLGSVISAVAITFIYSALAYKRLNKI